MSEGTWAVRISEARALVETGAVREQTWWRQTAADDRDGYAIVTTALSVLGWPALLRLDELKATAAAFGDYEIMQQGKGRTCSRCSACAGRTTGQPWPRRLLLAAGRGSG